MSAALELVRGPGETGLDAFRAVMAIVDYQRPHLGQYPSIDFLAFTAGLATSRFREMLNDLEERGLVERAPGCDERNLVMKLNGLAAAIRQASEEHEDDPYVDGPLEGREDDDMSPWS